MKPTDSSASKGVFGNSLTPPSQGKADQSVGQQVKTGLMKLFRGRDVITSSPAPTDMPSASQVRAKANSGRPMATWDVQQASRAGESKHSAASRPLGVLTEDFTQGVSLGVRHWLALAKDDAVMSSAIKRDVLMGQDAEPVRANLTELMARSGNGRLEVLAGELADSALTLPSEASDADRIHRIADKLATTGPDSPAADLEKASASAKDVLLETRGRLIDWQKSQAASVDKRGMAQAVLSFGLAEAARRLADDPSTRPEKRHALVLLSQTLDHIVDPAGVPLPASVSKKAAAGLAGPLGNAAFVLGNAIDRIAPDADARKRVAATAPDAKHRPSVSSERSSSSESLPASSDDESISGDEIPDPTFHRDLPPPDTSAWRDPINEK